jgi:hypothetical protein
VRSRAKPQEGYIGTGCCLTSVIAFQAKLGVLKRQV